MVAWVGIRKAELDKALYVAHAYIGKFPERKSDRPRVHIGVAFQRGITNDTANGND